jgi:DNA-binding MarR family transcriptional regulator
LQDGDILNRIGEMIWELTDLLKLVEKTEVECCGVTPYQGYTLVRLFESGAQPMQELALRMKVAVSTMTRNIDKLETKNFVTRERAAHDGRSSHVGLTPAGQAVAAQVLASWNTYFEKVESLMTPSQRRLALDGLTVLLEATVRAGNCCETNEEEGERNDE